MDPCRDPELRPHSASARCKAECHSTLSVCHSGLTEVKVLYSMSCHHYGVWLRALPGTAHNHEWPGMAMHAHGLARHY